MNEKDIIGTLQSTSTFKKLIRHDMIKSHTTNNQQSSVCILILFVFLI